jgi:site-specific recombinase XerD
LKPDHLQRLYSDKLSNGRTNGKGGLSNRSVHYIHVTLHKALKTAVKLGMIVRNPADAVEPPHIQHHEMQTMSESDVHIFLEFVKATPYYSLFYTALFTGMAAIGIVSPFMVWRGPDSMPAIGKSEYSPVTQRGDYIQAA